MKNKETKIILIDDEITLLELSRIYFIKMGLNIIAYNDSQLALDEILKNKNKNEEFVIITDHNMPKLLGIELIKALRKEDFNFKSIIITGFLNKEEEIKAEELCSKIFYKPTNILNIYEYLKSII